MKSLIQYTAGIVRVGPDLIAHSAPYELQASWSSIDPHDCVIHALVARTPLTQEHHEIAIETLKRQAGFSRVGFVRYKNGKKKEYWH